jgi:hypothetical protein
MLGGNRRAAWLLQDIMDELRQSPSPPVADRPISAEEARQGEIILKQPWQRWVFIAGLAAAVLLASAGFFLLY